MINEREIEIFIKNLLSNIKIQEIFQAYIALGTKKGKRNFFSFVFEKWKIAQDECFRKLIKLDHQIKKNK